MKHVALTIVPFLVVSLLSETSPAQEPDRPRERPSFDYGGAPEFDKPPLAHNNAEKRALAALEKMTQDK